MILDMLEELVRSGVRFVVIGGVAANAHGSARLTQDLDICYDTTSETLRALAVLINTWNPRLRVRREIGPAFPLDERVLRELASITLQTDRGAIDLLREVNGVGDYEACRGDSATATVGSLRFAVLSLDALIRSKRAAGRAKDREMLLELEALADLASQREEQIIAQEQLTAEPPASAPDSLEADLALFARIRRLQFEQVHWAHDPERADELQAILAALPPLPEVARRIVAAMRQEERLAELTAEQLATVREARQVLGAM